MKDVRSHDTSYLWDGHIRCRLQVLPHYKSSSLPEAEPFISLPLPQSGLASELRSESQLILSVAWNQELRR
jgi:hypothetical protein